MKVFSVVVITTIFSSIAVLSKPGLHNYDEWISIPEESELVSSQTRPQPATTTFQDPDSSIFVGIVSYREISCGATLYNLFKKAKYPNRIFVGLVQQVHTEQDPVDCITVYCTLQGGQCAYKDHISTIVLSHQDARGPGHTRFMLADLLNAHGEEFCMQTDAHTDVVENWDVELADMWGAINNEYAILSTDPPDLPQLGESDVVPHLCQAAFNDMGMVENAPPSKARELQRPLLASLYSSRFSFGKCHAELKVPHDPNLLYVTEGLDFSRFARYWTRGYDIYTPNKNLVAHDYQGVLQRMVRAKVPPLKDLGVKPDAWLVSGMSPEYRWNHYKTGIDRLKTLLGMPDADKSPTAVARLEQYGLGLSRSLDQFIQFVGIDTKRSVVFGDRCKPLKWQPAVYNSDPRTDPLDKWMNGEVVMRRGEDNLPLVSGPVSVTSVPLPSLEELLRGSVEKELSNGDSRNIRGASRADAVSLLPDRRRLSEASTEDNTVIDASSQSLRNRVELVENEMSRASGELWWIFQSVDMAVEAFIGYVDRKVEAQLGVAPADNGVGHGHRVLRFLLIFAPLFVFVIVKAVNVMFCSQSEQVRADIKKI